MITFIKIEDRGKGLVAVFEQEGFLGSSDKTFCLNREGLVSRIKNIEDGRAHPNRDASIEQTALAELDRQQKVINASR